MAELTEHRGNEKISFSCSSFRPPPGSRGYSHFRFKDKIIRGRFVEGSLHLNRCKNTVQGSTLAAARVVASMCFLRSFIGAVWTFQGLRTKRKSTKMFWGTRTAPLTTESFS